MKFNLSQASLLLLSFFSFTSYSEEIVVVPKFEAGFSSYSLDFSGYMPFQDSSIPVDSKFTDTLFVYRGGATFAYSKFYLDITGTGTTDVSDTQIIPELSAVQKWTANRTELNVMLGYSILESGSLFIGYRDGNIEADGVGNSNFEFESDGIFVGGNYGFPITETGTLSFNVVYAILDASLNETLYGSQYPEATGDGNGIKFGATWSDFLTDTISYSIAVDYYNYETDLAIPSSTELNMNEKEASIRVGLAKYF